MWCDESKIRSATPIKPKEKKYVHQWFVTTPPHILSAFRQLLRLLPQGGNERGQYLKMAEVKAKTAKIGGSKK